MSHSIHQALQVQDRSVSFRDAEVLLGHILGVDRTYLHTHPEHQLTEEQATQYSSFLQRREQNEPVAYITGKKEFYGRMFSCDKRALIPRPETEGLIDRAMAFLPTYFKEHCTTSNTPCPLHILELGTGTGNIACTLALELSAKGIPATILATDISSEALGLAQQNWEALKPEASRFVTIQFIESDLFNNPLLTAKGPYDLIATNLPYISTTWQTNPAAQPDVIFYEPDVALFGGEDGLALYRNFFQAAPSYLAPHGQVLCEYGETQTAALTELAKKAFPERKLTIHQDYADLDRLVEILT